VADIERLLRFDGFEEKGNKFCLILRNVNHRHIRRGCATLNAFEQGAFRRPQNG